jgi:hypothetical protein
MDNAVSYGKDLLRIKTAIEKTKSAKAKRDMEKASARMENELHYYCRMMGLKYKEVMERAEKG